MENSRFQHISGVPFPQLFRKMTKLVFLIICSISLKFNTPIKRKSKANKIQVNFDLKFESRVFLKMYLKKNTSQKLLI